LHTILHRTDLITVPLTLQTITIAMMMSIREKEGRKQHRIFIGQMLYCCPANSVKALKENQSTDAEVEKHQQSSSFVHPSLNSGENGCCSFTLALPRQYRETPVS